MAKYHYERTVQWGNWGIDFMDPNPDLTANFGKIIGSVYFPISTRGPFEGDKSKWSKMCEDWVNNRTIPKDFHYDH